MKLQVMQELLLYMYSGRCPNLSSMALDLLAAADRFQLPGLKEMADQVGFFFFKIILSLKKCCSCSVPLFEC